MFFRLHKTQISTTASLKSSAFVLRCCGCRCALVLIYKRIVTYLPAQPYNPDRVCFSFSCTRTQYTIYLVANTWNNPGNLLLVLYSFVFTASRVDDATPPKCEHGLFEPVFASIIVIVIVIDFLGFCFSVR